MFTASVLFDYAKGSEVYFYLSKSSKAWRGQGKTYVF